MEKRQWVQLLIHNLAGGDAPEDLRSEYHPRIMEKYFGLAFNDSILDQEDMYGKMKAWKVEPLIKTYCYPVVCNTKRTLLYINIEKSMPILRSGAEISDVLPVQGEGKSFTKMETVSSRAFNDMGTGDVTGETLYWREGSKLYFKNLSSKVEEILVKQIASISEYEDDDEVPIQAGKNTFIFESVYKWLRAMPPEDEVNDGNAKK